MKTEIKTTELETKTLNWLKNTGWYNYDNEPFYSDVVASEIAEGTGIDIASLKGVLGSLSKNCLLYTSPSPRDRQRSRMPSSA